MSKKSLTNLNQNVISNCPSEPDLPFLNILAGLLNLIAWVAVKPANLIKRATLPEGTTTGLRTMSNGYLVSFDVSCT